VPTILNIEGYRFYFYSNEGREPAHIHVQKERAIAKFWLKPVFLASSVRFSPKEIRDIQRLVENNHSQFIEAWNEYFKS